VNNEIKTAFLFKISRFFIFNSEISEHHYLTFKDVLFYQVFIDYFFNNLLEFGFKNDIIVL